ncbi:hypothetical protein ABH944_004841 [Caballeronia udeis]|uniref:Uncharacterized protein n=1 Tax=Caballeronia udeis TaxID=1232866 RepID=A0ABW8MPQ8_9BURK
MHRDDKQAEAVRLARDLCRKDWRLARIRVMVERGDPVAALAVRRLTRAIVETVDEMARRIWDIV